MNRKQKRTKKQQLIDKYGLQCWWCRKPLLEQEITIDHLVPKSRGGSDSLENLRPSCRLCNNARGNSLYPPKILKR